MITPRIVIPGPPGRGRMMAAATVRLLLCSDCCCENLRFIVNNKIICNKVCGKSTDKLKTVAFFF